MLRKNKENVAQGNAPAKNAEYRKYLVVGIVMLAIIFGAGVKYARFIDGSSNAGLSAQAVADSITVLAGPAETAEGLISVSLTGAVQQQGYYSVPEGTGLGELLDYVGLTEHADVTALDSKRVLQDGERVVVPFLDDPVAEVAQTPADEPTTKADSSTTAKASQPTVSSSTPQKITEASGKTININTATATQLMQLPNIGEKRAAAIIEYRKQNGNFDAIADILNVSGIGEKTYEKIKGLICVE